MLQSIFVSNIDHFPFPQSLPFPPHMQLTAFQVHSISPDTAATITSVLYFRPQCAELLVDQLLKLFAAQTQTEAADTDRETESSRAGGRGMWCTCSTVQYLHKPRQPRPAKPENSARPAARQRGHIGVRQGSARTSCSLAA